MDDFTSRENKNKVLFEILKFTLVNQTEIMGSYLNTLCFLLLILCFMARISCTEDETVYADDIEGNQVKAKIQRINAAIGFGPIKDSSKKEPQKHHHHHRRHL